MTSTDRPVVLVTGASRGLGAAIARCLDRMGAAVVLSARSRDKLEALASELTEALVLPADLSDLDRAVELVERAAAWKGRLDALVNNAGQIDPIEPLASCDPKAWAEAIQTNLVAPAVLTSRALPHLARQNGRVVHISSGAAVKVVQGWSAYCTAKAGLLHLSKIAAEECPEVAQFSLRPGVIDTDMQRAIRSSAGMTEADLTKFRSLHESGQLEPPEVPARAAAWLALRGPHQRSGDFIEYKDEGIPSEIDT